VMSWGNKSEYGFPFAGTRSRWMDIFQDVCMRRGYKDGWKFVGSDRSLGPVGHRTPAIVPGMRGRAGPRATSPQ